MTGAKAALLVLFAPLVVPLSACENASRAATLDRGNDSNAPDPTREQVQPLSGSSVNDVDRLLALEDIKQLKARYWRFMDEKKWDEFQSVFTDNVVFDLREALFARDWHTSPAETYAGGNDANVLYDPKSGDMLFTQDQINAILSPNNPAAGGWYVVGAQNVRNWEQGILDQQPGGPWVTVHHGHTPEITIDSPTTAHGIWRLEHTLRVPRQNPYASNPYYFWLPDNLPYHEYHGFGIYFETYVKTADGWKIASLKLEHFRVDIK